MDIHPSSHSKQHEQPQLRSIEYATHSLWTPTPLDPYAVQRDGLDYVVASQHILVDRVIQKAEVIGLDEQYKFIALDELFAAMHVRTERNSQSYDRLVASTSGVDLDEAMLAIIDKARGASADTQELLRLIKEHPDMISIEFFKRTTPFDTEEYRDACQQLQQLIIALKEGFKDADITHDFSGKTITTEPFMTEHGAIVWKECIGEARSVDSHTEIIVKHSMLALPPTIQLKGVKPNIIHFEGSGQTLNLLPLGISAYFRTADYKSRPGYTSPEDEHRSEVSVDLIAALGERAGIHEHVWEDIPPEMREVYAKYANSATDKLNSEK
jgi:hypothetical protein